MAKYRILRISHACEAGVREVYGKTIDYHQQCQGYDDRRTGRQFRCQCACHQKPKA